MEIADGNAMFRGPPLYDLKKLGKIFQHQVLKMLIQKGKILKDLNLWDLKTRPPPKATGPPKPFKYTFDYSTSQLPASDKWLAEGHVFSVIEIEYQTDKFRLTYNDKFSNLHSSKNEFLSTSA